MENYLKIELTQAEATQVRHAIGDQIYALAMEDMCPTKVMHIAQLANACRLIDRALGGIYDAYSDSGI